jgi:hypothetical protein
MNARVFNSTEQQLNSEQIIHRIAEEFQLWELARRGGSNDQSQEYTFRRKAVGVCVCSGCVSPYTDGCFS